MKELYKIGAYKTADNLLELSSRMKEKDGAVLVFVHKSVDGDCVGSGCAIAQILRALGCSAHVAMPEPLPPFMSFLNVEDLLFYPGKDIKSPEDLKISGKTFSAALSVDCSEGNRMGDAGYLYDMFPDSVSVDHHEVTHLDSDLKWVEPKASSACEMVFYCAQALSERTGRPLEELVDKRTACCLMAGMVTDTGRFTYTNTRPETLTTAGSLMELGGNITDVCYNLFDRKKKAEFYISNNACVNAEFYAEGKIAISVVTREMFEKFGAGTDDIADVVSRLRDVDGVELAIVLRETDEGKIRGNLRAKSYFDCAEFASGYNGGGHKKAAGFTIDEGDIAAIKEEIIERATGLL